MKNLFYLLFLLSLSVFNITAQEKETINQEEVIYTRKHGMALTMVVLKPLKSNQKGIISVISGSWYSNNSRLDREINKAAPFLKSGYTVFLTMHSSNPRFDIAEGANDIKKAVQFIRYNAKKYNIDPNNIGITGGSSGGHLSLLAGTSNDIKDEKSKNPIHKVSSKVQAVAVFYPPTDFLNWGKTDAYMNYLQHAPLMAKNRILGALKFQEYDSKNTIYKPIKDSLAIRKMSISVSPAQLVTVDDAPTFIIHGDKDSTVPLQQSQILKNKFDNIGVPLTLIIKSGANHGWNNMNEDRKKFVKWFDKYLKVD